MKQILFNTDMVRKTAHNADVSNLDAIAGGGTM